MQTLQADSNPGTAEWIDGVDLQGSLLEARPVGVIVRDEVTGNLYASTDAVTPTYTQLTGSTNQPSGVISVAKSGGDYTTVAGGLAAASSGDVVVVYPGDYAEQGLVMPDGVKLTSATLISVTSITGDGTADTITLGANCSIQDMRINGGAGGTGDAIATGATGNVFITRCVCQVPTGGGVGFRKSNSAAAVINQLSFNTGSAATTGIVVEAGSVRLLAGGLNFNNGSLTTGVSLTDAITWTGPGVIDFGPAMTITGVGFDFASGSANSAVETIIVTPEGGGSIASALNFSDGPFSYVQTGGRLHGTTNDFTADDGPTYTGSVLSLTSVDMRREQIDVPASFVTGLGDSLQVFYFDVGVNNLPVIRAGGRFSHGAPRNPQPFYAVEGAPGVENMTVLTYDDSAGTYTDVTSDVNNITSGTATMPGDADDAVLIGFLFGKFSNWVTTLTGALGSGTLVVEVSQGGSSWAALDVMEAPLSGTGDAVGDDIWKSTTMSAQHVDTGSAAFTAWAVDTYNGVEAFWLRVRASGALTTPPVINQIQIGTDRFVTDQVGVKVYGGLQRRRALAEWADSVNLSTSPGNDQIQYASGVTFAYTDNSFNNGQVDGRGLRVIMPVWVNTARKVEVDVDYLPRAAVSGDMVLSIE